MSSKNRGSRKRKPPEGIVTRHAKNLAIINSARELIPASSSSAYRESISAQPLSLDELINQTDIEFRKYREKTDEILKEANRVLHGSLAEAEKILGPYLKSKER